MLLWGGGVDCLVAMEYDCMSFDERCVYIFP